MAQTEMVTFITTTGTIDVELTKPTPGETTVIHGVRFEPMQGGYTIHAWRVFAADGRDLGETWHERAYPRAYFWSTDGKRTRKGLLHTMLGAFGALVIPDEQAA